MISEHLNENEAFLLTVFESSTDSILRINDQGTCLDANPAAGKVFGMPYEQLFGRNIIEFFDIDPPHYKSSAHFLSEGLLKGEHRLRQSTGSVIDVESYWKAHFVPGQHLVVIRDITRRKRSEIALCESQFDLNHAQAVAQTGSWRLDVINNQLLWSDETYRIFEIPKEIALTYETFLSRVHPLDKEFVDRKWKAALNGEPYDIEHRIIAGDTIKWVRQRSELEFNKEGMLLGGFGTVQDITEKKQAVDVLRESEQRFRVMADNTPVMIWVTNENGKIQFVNHAYSEFLGKAPSELDWKFLVHPDDSEAYINAFLKSIEDHTAFKAQARVLRADGEWRWVESYGAPRFSETGMYLGTVGSSTDITDHKRNELNERFINRLDARLRDFSDPHAIIDEMIRNTREYLNVDRCLMGKLNLESDELMYQHQCCRAGISQAPDMHLIFEIATPDFRDSFLAGETVAISDVRTDPRTAPYADKHTLHGTLAFAAARYVREARLHAFLSVHSIEPRLWRNDEITLLQEIVARVFPLIEHARTAKDLRESEKRLRLLSETAHRLLTTDNPQGLIKELCQDIMAHIDCQVSLFFLMDEEEGKLRLNAYAGIPEENAHRIEWLDSASSDFIQEGKSILKNTYNANDVAAELSKSYGIQAYACYPLIIQGKIIGSLSFGTKTRTYFSSEDLILMKTITDRVTTAIERSRLIEELKMSRDDLEMKVRERTAQFEQSNKALQEFTSIASHDMQEPLRKIITFGNMLRNKRRDTLNDLESEYIGKMENAASRMQTLLKSLLEYSRVTTSKNFFVQVDLNKLVSDVLDDLEGRINETGARVEIGHLPIIKADPNQMWQLFQNMISNALKYHGDEKPLVKIYDKCSKKKHWRIFIEDNGIGFDEKNLERIFAPFQRLHGKFSPYEGTGMGLAICKKIVERHGGEITAKSKPGEGSTFIVTFPKIMRFS